MSKQKEPEMNREQAEARIKQGSVFPFDGRRTTDVYRSAALGVLADLKSRKGIKHELDQCDDDIKIEIVDSLALIIQVAMET